jgi:hypothetical protein
MLGAETSDTVNVKLHEAVFPPTSVVVYIMRYSPTATVVSGAGQPPQRAVVGGIGQSPSVPTGSVQLTYAAQALGPTETLMSPGQEMEGGYTSGEGRQPAWETGVRKITRSKNAKKHLCSIMVKAAEVWEGAMPGSFRLSAPHKR